MHRHYSNTNIQFIPTHSGFLIFPVSLRHMLSLNCWRLSCIHNIIYICCLHRDISRLMNHLLMSRVSYLVNKTIYGKWTDDGAACFSLMVIFYLRMMLSWWMVSRGYVSFKRTYFHIKIFKTKNWSSYSY